MSEYPIAYAAYNKDLETRMQSTSGGVFTVFAEYFISKHHAVIYGAVFDDRFEVIHTRIENTEDLSRLRGSKYPQSRILDNFKNAKKDLDNGRTVMFVGTPCQIVGLKNYLGKGYQKLYCMDFVCHGVASNSIWRSYVEYLGRKGKIQNITFKHKCMGWKKWHFQVDYMNGTSWVRRGNMTKYMHSYLSYANIRPSCFECRFKGLSRVSDFTISDCWGIGEKDSSMNDNRGLSALLIQNDRAAAVFNEVSDNFVFKEYNAEELMGGNWTVSKSVPQHKMRTKFFELAASQGGMRALNRYFTPSIKMWIRYFRLKMKGKVK